MKSWFPQLILMSVWFAGANSIAPAADPPSLKKLDSPLGKKIDDAITKARDALLKANSAGGMSESEASIVAYALHKAGLSPAHPKIATAVDLIAQKITSGVYGTGKNPPQHIYEACCDAMLLVDLDPVAHQQKLIVLRDYIAGRQRPNGSWHYPVTPVNDDGDTSITQFALLGLWAVKRADVEVQNEVWEKAAAWLFATQFSDGGFAYHLNEKANIEASNPTISMTAAGASSLLIIQRMLYGDRIVSGPEAVPTSRKRFGVLEFIPTDQPAAKKPANPNQVKYETLEKNIKKSAKWLADHFTPRPTFKFFTYEMYGCERVGSLLETEQFGGHKWYEKGAESLVEHQDKSGDWIGPMSPRAMTAFGILFLSRATQSIVKPRQRVRLTGAGLLAGGRGLPDDLSKVSIQDGSLTQRKKLGPIDEMLADLEKSAVADVPINPQAVMATLQFDKPEELVGKLDQLPPMLKHPKAEVRQVAAWALGRSGDIRVIPQLIGALSDDDINVAADASLALCVLTRQPQGVVKGEFATERISPEPPEVMEIDMDGEKVPAEKVDAAKAAVAEWQRASVRAWTYWYLVNRPYDEREDRQQIRNK